MPVITSFDNDLMDQFADQTKGEVYRNPRSEQIDQLADTISADKGSVAVSYIPHEVGIRKYLDIPLSISLFIILLFALVDFSRKLRKS